MKKFLFLTVSLCLVVFVIPAYAEKSKQMEIVGPLPLPIDGTVNIGNEDPIQMEIVKGGSQQREPFQVYGGGTFEQISTYQQALTYTVEADKRLIIDNFTVLMISEVGVNGYNINGYIKVDTWVNGSKASHYFPFDSVVPSGVNFFWAILAKEVTLFADPGTELIVYCHRNDYGGVGSCSVSLTGYLEPVP